MTDTWWVNQGRSFDRGLDELELVWAPLKSSRGGDVSSWKVLEEVRPGDILVHYARGAVRGFSVVKAEVFERTRPWVYEADLGRMGRSVPVDFVPLSAPVPLEEIPVSIRVGSELGPFDINGRVKQGYLYPLDDQIRETIFRLLNLEIARTFDSRGRRTISINGETDRTGTARYRVEQPILRKLALAGRTVAECHLCGESFPARYLVAAHIKKRALASDKERLDMGNIMLACTFGCDVGFELGALRVDKTGHVYLAPLTHETIAKRLEGIVGRKVVGFSSSNRKYFEARERSFRQGPGTLLSHGLRQVPN